MDTFFNHPDELYRFFSFIQVSLIYLMIYYIKSDLPNLNNKIQVKAGEMFLRLL